jgi:tetratricopeptide (TPR) repeat protein
LDSKHAGALLGLGRLLFEQAKTRDDLRRAEQLFSQSAASDAQNVGALYNLGYARRKLGDERGAVEALERAHAIARNETSVMYQLGQAYLAVGRKEEGKRLLKEFEELASLIRERDVLEKRLDDERDNLPMHLRLAQLYLLFQEPAKSVRVCRLVLDQQPDHVSAHELIARGLTALGQRAEAERHLQQAVTLKRGNGEVQK